jgi:RTX calcium-binding nonapeptide repeat (4 copies)
MAASGGLPEAAMSNVNLIVGNDGSNTLQGTAGADLIYGYDPNGAQSQATAILANRVASGLTEPLFAGAPPGDTSRLFIVEKTGAIKILDLTSGRSLRRRFSISQAKSRATGSAACSASPSIPTSPLTAFSTST